MAWLVWAVVFGVALSPIDPLAASWGDEIALGAVGLSVLWRSSGIPLSKGV
jgi:hypothetical protein